MSALPHPEPPLADELVALRPKHRSDVPQLFAGFSDPLCQRFSWPRVEPFTRTHVVDNIEAQEQARLRGEAIDLAVVDATDPDLVLGATSLYDVDTDQARAAVGYWLAPDARGHGIATRSLRMLAAWAVDELTVARLELACAPDNVASQRVAERCGFVREGVLRSHIRFKDGRRDSVMYGLLPTESR